MGPFEKIHHLCLVVRDIDEKVKYYESVGIGPWQEFPSLSEYTDLHVPDLGGFKNLRYMFARVGDMQIQMCQPGHQDTPQKRFLETVGEGVYHIGFVVEDADMGEEAARKKGLKVQSRGRRPDSSGFTDFDTQKDAGVVLLIRQSPPGR